MAIQISCPACNVRLSLGDDRAGDRFECPACDALIKVPYPDGEVARPVSRPRTQAPLDLDPDPEPLPPDDEPTGPDRRVLAGIIAGVLGLLVVGVAVVLFAVRKPKEPDVAKGDETPPAPTVAPPRSPAVPKPAPADKPPPGKPAEVTPQSPGDSSQAPTPPDPPSVEQKLIAQFLGSQGTGQRFCIVADNSSSMTGAKLADLKVQLLKTIGDLDAKAEFYVYFFNTAAEPMPHQTWLKPGAPEVDKVREWVKKTPARGGTNPVPAFEAALKLDPKPDVVFLMTDGIFSTQVPQKLADLNGTPAKVVVNTILFEPAPKGAVPPKRVNSGEAQLKLIAEKGGGTFTRYSPP